MDAEFEKLTTKELRALLRQETRKFLLLLEQDTSIMELENLRDKLRVIADNLKQKELDAENGGRRYSSDDHF